MYVFVSVMLSMHIEKKVREREKNFFYFKKPKNLESAYEVVDTVQKFGYD